jgi:hypothetical protein
MLAGMLIAQSLNPTILPQFSRFPANFASAEAVGARYKKEARVRLPLPIDHHKNYGPKDVAAFLDVSYDTALRRMATMKGCMDNGHEGKTLQAGKTHAPHLWCPSAAIPPESSCIGFGSARPDQKFVRPRVTCTHVTGIRRSRFLSRICPVALLYQANSAKSAKPR